MPFLKERSENMENILTFQVHEQKDKKNIATEVLYDLPEWFGLPEHTQKYIEDAQALSFWVAVLNQEVLGFVTLKETSNDTAEIHCMGVKKAYHHLGVGTKLFLELEAYAKTKYKFLQVKTVEEGRYKEYDQTVSFYKKLGFSKLEVFPTLWDVWNPCLIMIKHLKDA